MKEHFDHVLFHKNCNDGFGSAFAVWYWFKLNHPNKLKTITFLACSYQDESPILQDKNILIVDFSFSESVTLNLIKNNKSLLIIDHHKTAEENLLNIPKENKIFDMSHSGAYLT